MQKRTSVPENKKKKIVKRILIGALVSAPLLVALIYFFFFSDVFGFSSQNLYSITLYDDAGNIIASEEAYPNYAHDDGLVSLFYPITSSLVHEQYSSAYDRHLKAISVSVDYMGTHAEYKFYFSFEENKSFCEDVNGRVYHIAERSAKDFLCSEYSHSLYEKATPVKLKTAIGDVIEPSEAQWSCQYVDGEYFAVSDVKTTSEIKNYYMGEYFDFYFEVEPYACNVNVKQNDKIIFSGAYSELSGLSLGKGDVINFEIDAEWVEADDLGFFGKLSYNFDVTMTGRPDFSISDKSVDINSFITLKCTNVTDASKISFVSEPSLEVSPKFALCGSEAIAFLPFAEDTPTGEYRLTISYGVNTETFTLELTDDLMKDTLSFDADHNIYDKAFSKEAQNELDAIKNNVSDKSGSELLFDGEYLDPALFNADKIASYGDRYRCWNIAEHKILGNEYSLSNSSVLAIGSGKVVKTGYNAYLGNYVVVSHGAGLATWYAHLSNFDVSEGDYVLRGEIVGKTGKTGFAYSNGFLLLATVYDRFVSLDDIL